ncbi:hypothetical protein FEM03_01490 [Phragmitibacter flavus]|uniref:Uncharacterized protein n=1 Tax=Phragmitibacter flavus TaxID=2576071 RepID=A0A5R8KKC3_9BACT|nr:hypothetical protein [Phragmitibacter flavus]TLD72774.1 hypothetical protein FEM03_01490 [Phragmitibacter flavus]
MSFPDQSKADWPISLTELIARRDVYSRRIGRVGGTSMVLLFSFLFGNFFLIRWLERDEKMPNWLAAVGVVVLFSYLFGNMFFLLWNHKKATKSCNLQCPHCAKPLTDKILIPVAIATGRCGNCGGLLIIDHPNSQEPDNSGNRLGRAE